MSAEERGGYGHETENENLKPGGDGPPRPATEPSGSQGSSDGPKTRTDPSTGEPTGGTPSKGG